MAIPDPEPGLVVHFNYLWSSEFDRGPRRSPLPSACAIVLSYRRTADGVTLVLLAPITHSEPRTGDRAIELPQAIKKQLGLDDLRSCIMVEEVNETARPGYDLQLNAEGRYAYGFIPPALFRRIKAEMMQVLQASRLRRIPR